MNTPAAQPCIWVHVTTLMNWSRPPVGIVRVEQEYCRWLLEVGGAASDQVRFCVADLATGSFAEVGREAVLAKLRPAAEATPSQRPQLAGWKRSVKRMLQALIPYLPAPLVPRLRSSARLAYHHLLLTRVRAAGVVSGAIRAVRGGGDHSSAPAVAPFAPGDRLVSLGLDWEYVDQKVLYRLKERLGLKTTLICYDVIPALFPHLVVLPPGGFGAYLVDMAWCADAVLCISEHTRRDCEAVLRRLGAPVPPTHVIRLGSEIPMGQGDGVAPQGLALHSDGRPFVLFVSTLERRKNHEILYRAWTRLRERGIVPYRLVFVGMQGWGVTDLMNDLELDPRIQQDIVRLNHVTDAELDWLYRQCAFTVFPSLYEGWGLPLVESLARGRFCLASNAASLPEAGGPWAEYLDPWDLPAWVERLAHYMQNPREIAALNERISREFVAPRWSDTAAAIHEVVLSAQPGRGER